MHSNLITQNSGWALELQGMLLFTAVALVLMGPARRFPFVSVGAPAMTPCVFRFRRAAGEKWERVNLVAAPRSAYLRSGPARSAQPSPWCSSVCAAKV